MELRYGLTIHEIMDFFNKEHRGFSKHQIQMAEQRIGASLPPVYKDFLLKYGNDDVNDTQSHIFPPHEIFTSYDAIQELLEDLVNDFEEAVQNGTQEEYADNPYFALWQLPKDQWHTVTQNHVLIWCENQGVWYAGYLMQDLLDGKEEPPVYIGKDDDIIEFEKFQKDADNTEHFLKAMTFEVAELRGDIYDNEEEIAAVLSNANIDIEKLKSSGRIGTCLDAANETIYYYMKYTYDNSQCLLRLEKTDVF